jgi:shikimate dehydrogenase
MMPPPRCTRNGWRLILNSNSCRQRNLGVVGHPVAHSLSPALHRAAYDVLGLPFRYEAVDVQPGGLKNFVTALDSSWLGLSVTMPHKSDARELADSIDALARITDAVNTLAFFYDDDGKRSVAGYNTDVEGMRVALADAGVETAREVAIVGGGATAASGIVAAGHLGAERVSVLVRNPARASHLNHEPE